MFVKLLEILVFLFSFLCNFEKVIRSSDINFTLQIYGVIHEMCFIFKEHSVYIIINWSKHNELMSLIDRN